MGFRIFTSLRWLRRCTRQKRISFRGSRRAKSLGMYTGWHGLGVRYQSAQHNPRCSVAIIAGYPCGPSDRVPLFMCFFFLCEDTSLSRGLLCFSPLFIISRRTWALGWKGSLGRGTTYMTTSGKVGGSNGRSFGFCQRSTSDIAS